MTRLRTLSKVVAELSPSPSLPSPAGVTSGFQVLLPCSLDCTSQDLCSHHRVHSHFPAVQPCSKESSMPLSSHPCSLLGLVPKAAARSHVEEEEQQLPAVCAYVQRDTAAPLLHTRSQHPPGSTTKMCSWMPWVRQGHNHSQDKFSHSLPRITCLRICGLTAEGKEPCT